MMAQAMYRQTITREGISSEGDPRVLDDENPFMELPCGTNVRVELDGQPLETCQVFEYAVDEEGYAAGKFVYLVTDENRPRARTRFALLELLWEKEDGTRVSLLRVPNVVIRAEMAGISVDDLVLEVECRWTNGD